jgi:hypothetical protein
MLREPSKILAPEESALHCSNDDACPSVRKMLFHN